MMGPIEGITALTACVTSGRILFTKWIDARTSEGERAAVVIKDLADRLKTVEATCKSLQDELNQVRRDYAVTMEHIRDEVTALKIDIVKRDNTIGILTADLAERNASLVASESNLSETRQERDTLLQRLNEERHNNERN